MMKTKRPIFFAMFFLISGIGIFLFAKPKAEDIKSAEFGEFKEAPEFELNDYDGKKVKLEDYKGKIVILNFWATWCGPCRREIPDFIDLQNTYGKDGLQFIGISLDQDGAAAVKRYIEKTKIVFNYPVLIGSNDIAEKYGGMPAIPVTFLIDRKGKIRSHYIGMRQKADLETMALALLHEK